MEYNQYYPIIWREGEDYVKNIGANILTNLEAIIRLYNRIESKSLLEGVKKTHPSVFEDAMKFVA